MEIPAYWLLSYLNIFLFEGEPSIIMLLARNIERFSVGCPSVFHSISLYMGVLITHRFSSKPLENKFYCFPICLQFVYPPNDVSALIASIVYFSIYWQKQTVFFTRLF